MHVLITCKYKKDRVKSNWEKVGWLCWGLTSQSTIFQSCRDGAIASWVINQYFRGVKCLAQGHNTAAVGLEPRTSRSGVRNSTTEPPRSPTEKRWRHHFPHYKSMGAFCCHGHQSYDPICLKKLCSLSPPPVMLRIKFDQGWPAGLRDIQVGKCKIFITHGQVTPKWLVWSGPKSNSSELLCLSWLPSTLMMIRSKINELAWRQHFPIISLWGFFLTLKGS